MMTTYDTIINIITNVIMTLLSYVMMICSYLRTMLLTSSSSVSNNSNSNRIQRRIRYIGIVLLSFVIIQLMIYHKQSYNFVSIDTFTTTKTNTTTTLVKIREPIESAINKNPSIKINSNKTKNINNEELKDLNNNDNEDNDTNDSNIVLNITKSGSHDNNDLLLIDEKEEDVENGDDEGDENGSSSSSVKYPPTIAFMFMMSTNQSIHEDIGERWFRSSSVGDDNDTNQTKKYSIYIHHNQRSHQYYDILSNLTTNNHSNATSSFSSSSTITKLNNTENITVPIQLNSFFCPHVIQSISTSYYCCLYRGMMQILQTAYNNDPYAEQFIFVSAATIPLISLNELYDLLIIQQKHQQSRFCFMHYQEKVWEYMAHKLNLNVSSTTRKAEMWSILSREHVRMLLQYRYVMDDWYNAFQRERYLTRNNWKYIGAPDEMFFATMFNIIQQNMTMTSNHTNRNDTFFEEDKCLDIPNTRNRVTSCCMTKLFWLRKKRPAIIKYKNRTILVSDKCKPFKPCTLIGPLYEEGLLFLQSIGYYFLRKVPHNHVFVKTALSNETISLYDALYYLHQHQPMKSITTASTVSSIEPQHQQEQRQRMLISLLNSHHQSSSLLLNKSHSQKYYHVPLKSQRSYNDGVDIIKHRHLVQNHNNYNKQQDTTTFQCFVEPVIDIEQCWCDGKIQT